MLPSGGDGACGTFGQGADGVNGVANACRQAFEVARSKGQQEFVVFAVTYALLRGAPRVER